MAAGVPCFERFRYLRSRQLLDSITEPGGQVATELAMMITPVDTYGGTAYLASGAYKLGLTPVMHLPSLI